MDNRNPRVNRVNYDRHASCKKIVFIYSKSFLDLIWKFSMDCRKINSSTIDNSSTLHNSGSTTTTTIALPNFFLKPSLSVSLFQPFTNLILNLPVTFNNFFFKIHTRKYLFIFEKKEIAI